MSEPLTNQQIREIIKLSRKMDPLEEEIDEVAWLSGLILELHEDLLKLEKRVDEIDRR